MQFQRNPGAKETKMKAIQPEQICFGLNPEHDKASFAAFLQLLGAKECRTTLASRISNDEMNTFVTQVYSVLKNNFSEQEYHRIFLQQTGKNLHPRK